LAIIILVFCALVCGWTRAPFLSIQRTYSVDWYTSCLDWERIRRPLVEE